MKRSRDQLLVAKLDALLAMFRGNWHWPSPETGFARYVFAVGGENPPVADADGIWPDVARLDQAPVLAAAGYLLGTHVQDVGEEELQGWTEGLRRLSGRNAFTSAHASFAQRPLDVLGIAVGAVNCPLVPSQHVDWLRGVLAKLRDEGPTEDSWSNLIYGVAASTVGEAWRDGLFFSLQATDLDVLSLLGWLAFAGTQNTYGRLADRSEIHRELVARLGDEAPLPRDVARAAVIYHSLLVIGAAEPSSPPEPSAAGERLIRVDITPRTLRNLRAGTNLQISVVEGDQNMGDKISVGGNVTGSALGTGASAVVGDITAYQSMVDNSTRLPQDLKSKLKAAREAVEHASIGEGDKKDVLDDLGKLTEEMEKSAPEPGRVARLFARIKDIAPSVASILSSTATITRVIGAAMGHPIP